MRRLSAIVLIALALVVSGLSLGSATGSPHESRHSHSGDTLRFLSTTQQSAELDLGKKGASLGDEYVFHDRLRSRHDRNAGTLDGVCTVTRLKGDDSTAQCLVTASLDDGDITTQGVVRSDERSATLAVTGGTADYSEASGEVHVKFLSETKALVSVDLTD